jgi:hypothetical protein
VYAGFGSGKQQVFVVFMAFGLILLALTRRRREYVPVLMAFLAIVFLLIKHPATRYAIALVPVVGCTFLYLPQIPGKLRNFPLIAVILFCLMGLISRTQSVLGLHRSLSQLEQMLREELDTEFRGCAVVMMGELPIKEWGLIYGHGPESADTPWPERLNRIFGRYFWLDDVHVSQFGKNMALADWVKIVKGIPARPSLFPNSGRPRPCWCAISSRETFRRRSSANLLTSGCYATTAHWW